MSTTYTYNLANLVTSLTNRKGTETLSAYAYTYYLDGNQATKADHTGRTTSYTYDGAGRLTLEAESGAADAVSKAYTFDNRGNRVTLAVSGVESYTTSYAYDLNNRLLTETKDDGADQNVTEYFYDPNGNTVAKNTAVLGDSSDQESLTLTADSGGTELYSYGGFNRLVSVENDFGLHTYAYRPDELRMSKTTDGVTVIHIWNGQNITAELNADGNIIDRYIRGVGLILSDSHGYYLYNAHGDVVQLTNSIGTVMREYHYDAFGNERSPNSADQNPFRYLRLLTLSAEK